VARQSLVLLRSRALDQYPPKALLISLQSGIEKGVLDQATVGASIFSIQLSTLKDIDAPVPPCRPCMRWCGPSIKGRRFGKKSNSCATYESS
jgi:hypothetical protein